MAAAGGPITVKGGLDRVRILAVSDECSAFYYDYYTPGKLRDFDLILSCGDLPREYLEFLVTMGNLPLLYVHGNHDDSFSEKPPEGCVCIDGRLYEYGGVRFLGLGGSYRYKQGVNMYTERQMKNRISRVRPTILRHGGFDVLVTHAPARHINDFDSLPHRGFACFSTLLDRYEPRYFVHGHIHQRYGVNIPRVTPHGKTTIINACGHYVIEM